MPRKATQKPAEEKPETRKKNAKASTETQEVEAPKPSRKAAKEKRETKTETKTETVTETGDSSPKTRHVPTRESVEKEFDDLIASVDDEIGKLREATAKSKGVKFLRTVNKRLKTLRNHALRVSKQRNTTRRNNTNSGFLKPVQISKDLATFTGWDRAQLRSRVDVTKFICDYIKQHNLQDPEDKRKIRVDSDANLKKLLKYDGEKDGKPLTYYSLQTYLKSHFSSPAQEAPAQEVAVSKKK